MCSAHVQINFVLITCSSRAQMKLSMNLVCKLQDALFDGLSGVVNTAGTSTYEKDAVLCEYFAVLMQ